MEDVNVVDDEVRQVRARCECDVPGSTLVTCVPALIQVRLVKGGCKQVTINLRYPDDYPSAPILVELKSKTLSEKLLQSLDKLCDQKAKDLAGEPHALQIIAFIGQFLEENPLSACFDEVQHVKSKLIDEGDTLKIKQKQGVLDVRCRKHQYYMNFSFTVPDNYPQEAAMFEEKDSNFPLQLRKVFSGNVAEILRQCVQPPLKKKASDPPFAPKPSLKRVVEYLIKDCIKMAPTETCRLCEERALPEDPAQVVTDQSDVRHVERIYCGHLYHYGCLNKYMTTPPFKDGKKCFGCGKRIFHDRWTPNTNLAEARWAHHQARERELHEVAEFLQ